MKNHTKDFLNVMNRSEGKLKLKWEQIKKSPYFQGGKSNPPSRFNGRNKIQKQCGQSINLYRQKLRVATEGFQKIPNKKQRKSRQTLKPLLSYQKFPSDQQCQKRGTQDYKEQILKRFLLNHNQMIKQWQRRELVQKVHFIDTIRGIRQRKGKSFSFKKKKNLSQSSKELSLKKKSKSDKQGKDVVKADKSQIICTKRLQKQLVKLKTIQAQMYKQHLMNLIEINEKNQRFRAEMKDKIRKEAREKYIRSQKKKLKQQFEDTLRQKTQQNYYEQLGFYPNQPTNLQQFFIRKNEHQSPKKANQIESMSPVTCQQQTIEDGSSGLDNQRNKLIEQQGTNLIKEQSVTKVQKNDQTYHISSKVGKNLRINQAKNP